MTDEEKKLPPDTQDTPTSKRSRWPSLFSVVMALWGCTLLLVFLLLQKVYDPPVNTSDPAQTEYWGEVRQIQFQGATGRLTQIDTDRKTFLVVDSWLVDKGTQLERRSGAWKPQVCVVGTTQCRELASKP